MTWIPSSSESTTFFACAILPASSSLFETRISNVEDMAAVCSSLSGKASRRVEVDVVPEDEKEEEEEVVVVDKVEDNEATAASACATNFRSVSSRIELIFSRGNGLYVGDNAAAAAALLRLFTLIEGGPPFFEVVVGIESIRVEDDEEEEALVLLILATTGATTDEKDGGAAEADEGVELKLNKAVGAGVGAGAVRDAGAEDKFA
jgi:predicted nucleic acid-binding Zn ribbon protein